MSSEKQTSCKVEFSESVEVAVEVAVKLIEKCNHDKLRDEIISRIMPDGLLDAQLPAWGLGTMDGKLSKDSFSFRAGPIGSTARFVESKLVDGELLAICKPDGIARVMFGPHQDAAIRHTELSVQSLRRNIQQINESLNGMVGDFAEMTERLNRGLS